MFSAQLSFRLTMLLILPAFLITTMAVQPSEEEEASLRKFEAFMDKIVNPLDVLICQLERGKWFNSDDSVTSENHPVRGQFCQRIHRLQMLPGGIVRGLWESDQDAKNTGDEVERQQKQRAISGLIASTFLDVKHAVTSKLLIHLMTNREKNGNKRIFLLEVDIVKQYKILKRRSKEKLAELKLLQFLGDYSSERAQEVAYECVYIGRKMAEMFNGSQDSVAGLLWAFQQFPVDLLVYKMEVPELRDIRIEWEEPYGIIGVGIIPEGYEKAKALLDHLTAKITKPLEVKCQEIDRNGNEIESLFCHTVFALGDPVNRLVDALMEVDNKFQGAKLEIGQQKDGKGKEKLFEKSAKGSSSRTSSNDSKILRSVTMKNSFLEMAIVIEGQTQYLLEILPEEFKISGNYGFTRTRLTENEGRKLIAHFKITFEKLQQRYVKGSFSSIEVREMAIDCISSVNKLLNLFESPVEQLVWSVQQFMVNLMAISMELPWVRELPVQNMNSLIAHTKAVQLLEKFHGQILEKLMLECHGTVRKVNLEDNLCTSVLRISESIDQLETALEKPHTDGGVENMEDCIAAIKHQIMLDDTKGLWGHLARQIPKESEQIKVEVDIFRDGLTTDANSLKLEQRFEGKLKKFRELQEYGDFSSVHAKQVAFDCVYIGNWMVFGREWDSSSQRQNPLYELASVLRQFAVDLLVYRMEIAKIRDIPDILLWTHAIH